MATKTYIAAIVGLVLVSSAGLAAATYQGRSIWGGNNPGQGAEHAAMPEAAADHNRAGADHPFPDHNETGDENETGLESGQPDDVPPAHAKDGVPSEGKPADVPPAHSSADEHPAENGTA